MKVMNFRRFDPAFTSVGRVGLAHGSKDDESVWNEFARAPERLRRAAAAIRDGIALADHISGNDDEEEIVDAQEGRLLTVLHLRRERSRKLVEARKNKALKDVGELRCECCDLNFEERYGERGRGFIEIHHTKPVHTLVEGYKTSLGDLALVCSNCHRMIHRQRPWLSVAEVRDMVRSR
jgi:5-methylcytosine-specific restriction protein A